MMRSSTWQAIGRLGVVNLGAALLVTLAFSDVTWQTPWRDALEAYLVALLFSGSISPLVAITMRWIGPRVSRRVPFPFDWVVYTVMIGVLAVLGSGIAVGILAAFGYLSDIQAFVAWMKQALWISIVMTLTFGIFASAFEMLRARLERTTIALRTKERDEAEARRLAAEAQLAALEARVQPHFLFNTLNSIASLIPTDPAGAERMVGQLAALLRSSLAQPDGALVTLGDELDAVRSYLDIERVRFGDRLRATVHTDGLPATFPVPRLAIQTLVENSVKYAVSPRREGATIDIRGELSSGRARVVVEDDGPGFDVTGLPPGHGLALLRDRLALTYGTAASVTFDSRPGRTVTTLELPLLDGDTEPLLPDMATASGAAPDIRGAHGAPARTRRGAEGSPQATEPGCGAEPHRW
jgi:signal transduction histidine kinase